jgi:indolepyruvate ferredoxin oxidoreductase beta subunit
LKEADNRVWNITFGGVGGQGILKAAEICAWAAMLAGYHVKKSEVHGMAQRGGSVESHVRFGRRVYSPLVAAGTGDYLVTFEKEEHPRLKGFLRKGGVDLTGYLDKAQAVITNPRHLNTYLLGVLSAHLTFKEGVWLEAIRRVFPEKIVEENIQVFLAGRRTALP